VAKRDVVKIGGAVLAWARKRAKLEPAQLGRRMGKGFTADHISAWENGSALPTFAQAEKLADILHLPFGLLFMEKPPPVVLPIPDRRTVAGTAQGQPSLEFLDVVNDCLLRQHWYRDERMFQKAQPLGFVGRFSERSPIDVVAADIASTLSINDELRRSSDTWEGFLGVLIDRIEAAGILVMRNSIAGYATRRGLSVDEFRGFVISDNYAPLVFINGKDARSAQVFTLAHELVHIWIGQSAISNANPKTPAPELRDNIESYCNRAAAELLVPARNVAHLWRPTASAIDNIAALATFHRVSKTAAAIRVRDLNRISREAADAIIEAENQRFADKKAREKEKEGGPGFWTLFPSRNSPRLVDAVVSALREGRVFYRDAANLLGVRADSLQGYVATR
jgi:Zn-dependent peptidase ImmA (M78 family)